MSKLTYAKSGVNRKTGDALVDFIAKINQTRNVANIASNIGGYASLYKIN
ncbi:MAG: hypothetical protein HY072_05225 [Deltaproteobacteria bacterium]|nr:hypothetical protein [Deltaproteobacteria bacterium]